MKGFPRDLAYEVKELMEARGSITAPEEVIKGLEVVAEGSEEG